LAAVALPRTHTYEKSASDGATSPPAVAGWARSVAVRRPPVCVPISCESATRSLRAVPVSSSALVSSGSNAASSSVSADASKQTSA
jgi:hypothetical protein